MLAPALALALALAAVVHAQWPPIRVSCGNVVRRDLGTFNEQFCCPQNDQQTGVWGEDGTDPVECARIAHNWNTGKCQSQGVWFCGGTNYRAAQPGIVNWIGSGTPKPCVEKAKSLGRKPAEYCKEVGSEMTWGDGGCRLWDECPIILSRDVCERHPWCAWEGGDEMGHCEMKSSIVNRPCGL